jgi:hypothetical protein
MLYRLFAVGLLFPGTLLAMPGRGLAGPVGAVIQCGPSKTERFAAEELQTYLEKIAATRFPIEKLGERPGDAFVFTVANNAGDDARRLALGREEYHLKSVSGGLLLSGGGGRGTLYAVYDFLERLGCRWYYMDPEDEIVPTLEPQQALAAGAGLDVVEKPAFSVRMRQFLTYDLTKPGTPLGDRTMKLLPARIAWMARNRINMFQYGLDDAMSRQHWPSYRAAFGELQRRDMVIGVSGHSLFLFLPDKELSKHQDWWPEKDGKRQKAGQFCTRNPAAVAFYIDQLTAFLRENPEVAYVAAWPADTGGWCECQRCRDTPLADRFMEFGKQVQAEIARRAPGVTYSHFAYGTHLDPPRHERPTPGMTITVCTWGRDFSKVFSDPGTKREFQDAFRQWRHICDENGCRLVLHEKYLRHLWLGFHPLPLGILQPDIAWFHGRRLDGFELPMGFMGRRTKALNFYVTCKLLWNTSAPVAAIVDDYFEKCYGPAAAAMHAAYLEVERAQPDLHYGKDVERLHGSYVPLEARYAGERYDAAVLALRHFELAEGHIRRAIANVKDARTAGRIERFAKSLRYVRLEYQGLRRLAEVNRALAGLGKPPGDPEQRASALRRAQESLDRVKEIRDRRKRTLAENPGSGLYWDDTWEGGFGVFVDNDVDRWQKTIDRLRND